MSYRLLPVSPSMIPDAWRHVLPLLKPAIDRTHGLYAPEDVYRACCEARQQLWAVLQKETLGPLRGAVVTEVVDYPRARALWIAFAGGTGLDAVTGAMERLEAFAREQGCSLIRAEGRRGWLRAAGFEDGGAVLYKTLTHQENRA